MKRVARYIAFAEKSESTKATASCLSIVEGRRYSPFRTCPSVHLDHHHLCRRNAIKGQRAGAGIGADGGNVNHIADVELRQLLAHRDRVERIARRAGEDARELLAALERLELILAVIEDLA